MRPLVEGLKKQNPQRRVPASQRRWQSIQPLSRWPTSSALQYVPTFVFVDKDGCLEGQLVGEQTTETLQADSGQAEVAGVATTSGRVHAGHDRTAPQRGRSSFRQFRGADDARAGGV